MATNQSGRIDRMLLRKQGAGPPGREPGANPLDELVQLLHEAGYTIIAPLLVDDVMVLRPIASAGQLPRGVQDEQSPGHYRTLPGDPAMYFDYVVGPDSPKRWLFPPVQPLFSLKADGDNFEMTGGPPPPPRIAFLGMRPCELAAMGIQDRVFGLDSTLTFRCETDPYYSTARRDAFIIVVNCMKPGGTCFCSSMGTGPKAAGGFDLALTELRYGFIVEIGSDRGRELCQKLPLEVPSPADLELTDLKLTLATKEMSRRMNTDGLPALLERAADDPFWDRMANKCLACGNCTMVCPTCFCSTVVDSNDLAGGTSRTRSWESCYTHQFSYTTAGPGRSSIRGRHRHWLRHKLCTWWEQFGTSGCVGCGRCITWCPVGIDITAEVAELQGSTPTSPVPPGARYMGSEALQ